MDKTVPTPTTLGRWATLLAAAVLLAACGGTAQTTQTVTLPVRQGDLSQSVSSSGQVQALRESYLNFATSGTIAEVLVVEGQRVEAGAVLAALDTDDLDQQIRQAEANLKSAQANLADLQDGALETDLRTAQSQLESAQLQLNQTARGNATAAEIASARAQLDSARAALAALRNPNATNRADAEQAVRQAEIDLQATRDSASATKTNANLSLQKAAQSLTQAQSRYATAKKDWDFIQGTGANPSQPETVSERRNEDGSTEVVETKNHVSDTQRQQYYDTYVQAESALRNAEADVQQAQVSYDNARQQEVIDVQKAEMALADAQRQLDALLNPDAEALAQAQAQVAQAEASLDNLTRGGTQTDVAIAQQTVTQRQAALDALTAPPSTAELAQAEAQVAQAEASLAEARSARDDAELVAPFAGVVAAVNITLGDSAASSSSNSTADTAAIYLVDDSSYYVDMAISEVDLAQLAIDQPAQVTIDALPDQVLTGTLSYIAAVPTVDQNVTTYDARIALAPSKAALRIGLSAAVTIVVAQAEDVLLVPNIAIQQSPEGPQVTVRRGEQDVPTTIETGLAGETQTEVRSGLQAGDQVVVTVQGGTSGTQRIPGGFGGPPSGGPPNGGGTRGGGGGGGGGGPRGGGG